MALFLLCWVGVNVDAARKKRSRRPVSSSGSSGDDASPSPAAVSSGAAGSPASSSSPRSGERGSGGRRSSSASPPSARRRRVFTAEREFNAPWMRYAVSVADFRRLGRMGDVERELEISRRADESMRRIQRAILVPAAEAELTAFDRMLREESRAGYSDPVPPYLPFFLSRWSVPPSQAGWDEYDESDVDPASLRAQPSSPPSLTPLAPSNSASSPASSPVSPMGSLAAALASVAVAEGPAAPAVDSSPSASGSSSSPFSPGFCDISPGPAGVSLVEDTASPPAASSSAVCGDSLAPAVFSTSVPALPSTVTAGEEGAAASGPVPEGTGNGGAEGASVASPGGERSAAASPTLFATPLEDGEDVAETASATSGGVDATAPTATVSVSLQEGRAEVQDEAGSGSSSPRSLAELFGESSSGIDEGDATAVLPPRRDSGAEDSSSQPLDSSSAHARVGRASWSSSGHLDGEELLTEDAQPSTPMSPRSPHPTSPSASSSSAPPVTPWPERGSFAVPDAPTEGVPTDGPSSSFRPQSRRRRHPMIVTGVVASHDWDRHQRFGAQLIRDDLEQACEVHRNQTFSWRFAPVLVFPLGLPTAYSRLVYDLLSAPPVPPASQNESFAFHADLVDERFLSAITELENFRRRPAHRGPEQLALRNESLPLDVWELADEDITTPTAPWELIPRDSHGRGMVSEWFPARPFPHDDGNCPACEAILAGVRMSLLEGRFTWRDSVRTHSRVPVAAANAIRGLETEPRGGLVLDVNSHTCALGDYMHFPRVLYTIQNRPTNVGQLRTCRVRVGVTFHLGIPGGLPIRWSASTFVRMVFPLFGSLRYFWGRVAMVSGEVTFARGPSASGGQVVALGALRLSVAFREEADLEYSPLILSTTHVEGARPDVTILGASFRWLGRESGSYRGTSMRPASVTQEELQRVLRSIDVPSSLLVHNRRTDTWEIVLPEAPRERCTGRPFQGRRRP